MWVKSDGDGCTREERKIEAKVDGQHQAQLDCGAKRCKAGGE